MGKKEKSNLEKSCAPFCKDDDLKTAKRDLLFADISLGVGVLSAIGAVVVYATRPVKELPDEKVKPGKEPGTKTSFGIDALPSGAAFDLRGTF